MYNIRYHIASLVAVFLALALGLVLGGLVVQQGTFSKQQKALVEESAARLPQAQERERPPAAPRSAFRAASPSR